MMTSANSSLRASYCNTIKPRPICKFLLRSYLKTQARENQKTSIPKALYKFLNPNPKILHSLRKSKRTQNHSSTVKKNKKMQNRRSWVIVKTIACGTHCTVSLAEPRRKPPRTKLTREGRIVRGEQFPPLMAVKSAEISDSALLQKEKLVLADLQGCPQILHFYEDEFTEDDDNGRMIYNLLVEHASGGNLFELIKKNSRVGGLPESDVKRYTRSILLGLDYIHRNGYVHLNIKPSNILLVPSSSSSFCLKKRKKEGGEGSKFDAKIGGFGIAKSIERVFKETRTDSSCLVGTPQYMSPESITEYKQEPPCDIWSLGCVVAEMLSGKPVYSCNPGDDVYDLLDRIGFRGELPRIPTGISKEGADFLKRCFVRNSQFRWTAEMLLFHPFVAEADLNTIEGKRGAYYHTN